MSVNSSASSINTHPPPSINSSFLFSLLCLFNKPNSSVFMAFTITNVLLLFTLCILVLYHGFQRWRQQRPSTAASHSDSFTYHLASMEILNVIGSIICCCGIYRHTFPLLVAWYCLYSFAWYGETFFHVVTCVEHYLAVVHPITYLNLRKEKGIRIRNVIIGLIWLLSLGGAVNVKYNTECVDACLVSSSVLTIIFCSLSVLWALVHPGPGEQRRDQRRLTQTKQRAFYTILAIFAALLVRFILTMVWGMLSILNGVASDCSWIMVGVWCNIPSSLVSPLLFLQRAGQLMICQNGQE